MSWAQNGGRPAATAQPAVGEVFVAIGVSAQFDHRHHAVGRVFHAPEVFSRIVWPGSVTGIILLWRDAGRLVGGLLAALF